MFVTIVLICVRYTLQVRSLTCHTMPTSFQTQILLLPSAPRPFLDEAKRLSGHGKDIALRDITKRLTYV